MPTKIATMWCVAEISTRPTVLKVVACVPQSVTTAHWLPSVINLASFVRVCQGAWQELRNLYCSNNVCFATVSHIKPRNVMKIYNVLLIISHLLHGKMWFWSVCASSTEKGLALWANIGKFIGWGSTFLSLARWVKHTVREWYEDLNLLFASYRLKSSIV